MMKRLFLALWLALGLISFAEAQDVGYFQRDDCGSLTPVESKTLCLQQTTVSGRTAGHVYVYRGATWVDVESGGGGSGDITDVWGCTTGNCNALTGAAGDSLDAGSADAISPTTRSTSLPGTCTEGQHHHDTDSGGTETYVCTAANTWTKFGQVDAITAAAGLAGSGSTTVTLDLDVNDLTATDVALDDAVPLYDTSAAATRKLAVDRLLAIAGYPVKGRLTTESGVCVSTSDRTSQGTIYFTPCGDGNTIAIYDGTRWKLYTYTEKSYTVSCSADQNKDLFIYDNAGTLTLEASAAWTNDTTRADALTTQDGVTVKSGATTRRWLGTFRCSGLNVVEDSAAKRFVWNRYNRVSRPLSRTDTTATWTYTTSDYRQANAATANRVEVVTGLAESVIELSCRGVWYNATTTVTAVVAIGEDSTTTPEATVKISFTTPVANQFSNSTAHLVKTVPLGYHAYNWLEWSEALGTTTWAGESTFDADVIRRAGLMGSISA